MTTTFSSLPDAHDADDPENVTRGTFIPLTVDDEFQIFDWFIMRAEETRKVDFIEVTIHWQDE